jgi:hypothetical protein
MDRLKNSCKSHNLAVACSSSGKETPVSVKNTRWAAIPNQTLFSVNMRVKVIVDVLLDKRRNRRIGTTPVELDVGIHVV